MKLSKNRSVSAAAFCAVFLTFSAAVLPAADRPNTWEESTRVPFIVRAPGVTKAGGMVEHPIGLIDLYPTLVDLCGLKGDTMKNAKGKALDGHSVRPFLKDPESRKWDGPDCAISMIFAGEASKTGLER